METIMRIITKTTKTIVVDTNEISALVDLVKEADNRGSAIRQIHTLR
jgi:hypothetical protein